MLEELKKTNPFIYNLIKETLYGIQKIPSDKTHDYTMTLKFTNGDKSTWFSGEEFLRMFHQFFNDYGCVEFIIRKERGCYD